MLRAISRALAEQTGALGSLQAIDWIACVGPAPLPQMLRELDKARRLQ